MTWTTHAIALIAGATILGATTPADAAVIQFREGTSITFNGQPTTNVTFDDAGIGIGGATASDTSSVQTVLSNGGQVRFGLIAIKDLFTLVPRTSGDATIKINSATLYLTRINGSDSYTLGVARVTTDWLLGSAGTSEANVSGAKRSISDDLSWANGSFSTADYTTDGAVTSSWIATPTFDITAIIADMYATQTNYGIVVHPVSGGINAQQYTSSERSSGRPVIAIDYEYATVPEPAAFTLMGVGLMMLGHRRRRA